MPCRSRRLLTILMFSHVHVQKRLECFPGTELKRILLHGDRQLSAQENDIHIFRLLIADDVVDGDFALRVADGRVDRLIVDLDLQPRRIRLESLADIAALLADGL